MKSSFDRSRSRRSTASSRFISSSPGFWRMSVRSMWARTRRTCEASASLFIAALSFWRAASCFPSKWRATAAMRNASGPFMSAGWGIETRKSAGA